MSWLTENDVVEAVAKHLADNGWKTQTCNTLQQGIDVIATKGKKSLAIEAKGGTSSKRTTARFGKEFSFNQKKSHVSGALLASLREFNRGKHSVAMAFPDDEGHMRLIEEILPSLRKIGMTVYIVGQNKEVTVLR